MARQPIRFFGASNLAMRDRVFWRDKTRVYGRTASYSKLNPPSFETRPAGAPQDDGGVCVDAESDKTPGVTVYVYFSLKVKSVILRCEGEARASKDERPMAFAYMLRCRDGSFYVGS